MKKACDNHQKQVYLVHFEPKKGIDKTKSVSHARSSLRLASLFHIVYTSHLFLGGIGQVHLDFATLSSFQLFCPILG